ncbi:protein-methionine-sulfoxide reductase catalytic subunit MsrP [Solimonas marina]|uniref:Protein-methionine-sulfoxide reductase catalytic subunit MsrP n=1 Tax=Solimonas marina TaxID=2714601 RepID=A0A970B7K2_9GAMM|nr:protein-methionine-sulfoxide reductase catalytic subunit MsrP [Solimonas marina]NKF21294.1 protein-methionine-sulfoxide reductase catalytic subunit MsrP [Solimonas marina]
MLIRILPPHALRESEITPQPLYLNRRQVLAGMGADVAALSLPLSACAKADAPTDLAPLKIAAEHEQAGGETVTPFSTVSTYNNYYEFGTSKSDPAENAHTLQTRPWTVEVDGECEAPARVDIDSILARRLEQRVYRHRCVEAWSIVVPWDGFALGDFLKQFKPTSKAKYVAFQTLYDPKQMPETRHGILDWPYVEGLRIDEAMHPLAFLSVGMYGKVLPNQDGAPLRLTIPWKYGFKSIKSIVRIRFTEQRPPTTWNKMASNEYGFYANVNPHVDHPRWSQARERRLGELFKRDTLMFNGYPEVASLYSGLNLRMNY